MSIIEDAINRLNRSGAAAQAALPVSADPPPGRVPSSASRPGNALATRSDAVAPTRPKRHVDIDLDRLRELGMVTMNERTTIGEEFRTIKRPLLLKVMSERSSDIRRHLPANVIMVTSSVPREGKTYCAVNLAMSIACEKDYHVLLVDADVLRPSIPKTLGIPAGPGLMDTLKDGGPELDSVIVETNIPSLSILTSGASDRQATEMLSSQAMARLVSELASRYHDRIVIFDSPPLLATTESQVLASHLGQIVVVVEAQSTTQNQLKEALQMLAEHPHVNLLYNKARRFSSEAMYGSYN